MRARFGTASVHPSRMLALMLMGFPVLQGVIDESAEIVDREGQLVSYQPRGGRFGRDNGNSCADKRT
jgi:hypothetical protein